MSNVYFGIDLGTSNSSIAYVIADPRYAKQQTVPVHVVKIPTDPTGREKSDRLPSVVAKNFADRRVRRPLIGWEFFAACFRPRARVEALRHGENFFRSVKSDMGSNRIYPWAFDAKFNSPVKVSACIIEQLVEVARRERGHDARKSQVVITVPASFGVLARQDTLEAARSAGLDPERIELLDEPIAALIDLLNSGEAADVLGNDRFRNLLVFDYGGGTCDLTLVRARYDLSRPTGIHVEPLAISQYRQLGGDDIDRAVMAEVIWPQIERHIRGRESMSLDARSRIEDTLTCTVARRLKERVCNAATDMLKENPRTWPRVLRIPAKTEQAPRPKLPELGKDLPSGYSLSAAQLGECMQPFAALPKGDLRTMGREYPRSLLVPIYETLERGKVPRSDLDAIVLNGGSCRNPFVNALLGETLSKSDDLFARTKIIQTPDLDCSVARGAAVAAYWKHARRVQVVRPIIAEDIGVVGANDVPVVLLKAGTPLPFPETGGVHTSSADLYVPRDGQQELLVPIYTAARGLVAGSVRVPLPSGTQKGAAVRIKVQVGENKLMRWWFSIEGGVDVEAPSLDDPCTQEVPTRAWRKVLDHRRAMKEDLEHRGEVSLEALVTEAFLLYQHALETGTGQTFHLLQAQLAAEDVLPKKGEGPAVQVGRAWNIKGLVLFAGQRWQEATESFRQAAKADPRCPAYSGNSGVALFKLGRSEEAEAAMRQSVNADMNLAYLYEWLGDLYRSQGKEAKAMNEYREATSRATQDTIDHPRWEEAWERRARLHQKLGEYEQAREAEETRRALRRDARYLGDSRDMVGVLWHEDQA